MSAGTVSCVKSEAVTDERVASMRRDAILPAGIAPPPRRRARCGVPLTGATGFLGCHVRASCCRGAWRSIASFATATSRRQHASRAHWFDGAVIDGEGAGAVPRGARRHLAAVAGTGRCICGARPEHRRRVSLRGRGELGEELRAAATYQRARRARGGPLRLHGARQARDVRLVARGVFRAGRPGGSRRIHRHAAVPGRDAARLRALQVRRRSAPAPRRRARVAGDDRARGPPRRRHRERAQQSRGRAERALRGLRRPRHRARHRLARGQHPGGLLRACHRGPGQLARGALRDGAPAAQPPAPLARAGAVAEPLRLPGAPHSHLAVERGDVPVPRARAGALQLPALSWRRSRRRATLRSVHLCGAGAGWAASARGAGSRRAWAWRSPRSIRRCCAAT